MQMFGHHKQRFNQIWGKAVSERGFLGHSNSKGCSCNSGDPGLIPGSGRSFGERHGNPLQYSCLENSMNAVSGSRILLLAFLFFSSSSFFIFIYFFYLFKKIFFNQLEANYFTILQWFLSYFDMNQPWIYMYSPSRSPLSPPSPPDPSGSSQCTRPEHLSHASNLGW